MNVVEWCARECERQRSGEMSVWWMYQGWSYADAVCRQDREAISEGDVLRLGRLVEPRKAAEGYRTVTVGIRHYDAFGGTAGDWFEPIGTTPEQVPRYIQSLLEAQDSMDPEEWFMHYETCHPFVDGNGRTGAILYNWLRGTLSDPVEAPEYRKPAVALIGAP